MGKYIREGRASVEDAPHPGTTKLATNQDKLAEVKTFIVSPILRKKTQPTMSTFQQKCTYFSDDGIGTEEGPSAMGATLFNFSEKGRKTANG